MTQPENPSQPSQQVVERTVEVEERVMLAPCCRVGEAQNNNAAPVVRRTVTHDKTDTKVGAAFRDDSRTVAAKLNAMKPIQWVGILCVLGSAAFFYFKWWTPGVISVLTGIGMITLAAVIPGNETAILLVGGGGLVVSILLVFYAYKSGKSEWAEEEAGGRLEGKLRRKNK